MSNQPFKNLLNEKDNLELCFKCSFCSEECPINKQIHWASFSPRGKMLILRELLKGEGSLTERVIDTLYTCTLCGNCDTSCIAGISVTDILFAARRDFYELEKTPETFTTLMEAINRSGNVFDMPAEAMDILELNPKIKLPRKADLLFFKGCYASYHSVPNKSTTLALNVLKTLNVDFTTLESEKCCGSPAFLLGNMNLTERLCEYNVSKIEEKGASRVVTACPGCYRILKEEYPKFQKMDFEVLHITELLAEYIDSGKLVFKKNGTDRMNVLYQDPCELGRHCGVFEAPRKILETIPQIRLEEFDKNKNEAICCGGGGGLTIANSNLANKIAQIRLNEAEERAIPVVITACPACQLNFTSSKDKYNMEKLKILDINELVSNSIDVHKK